jgi:hypothetical protein
VETESLRLGLAERILEGEPLTGLHRARLFQKAAQFTSNSSLAFQADVAVSVTLLAVKAVSVVVSGVPG